MSMNYLLQLVNKCNEKQVTKLLFHASYGVQSRNSMFTLMAPPLKKMKTYFLVK